MKLQHILEQLSIDDAKEIVYNYTNFWEDEHMLDRAVQQLMMNKDFVYNGQMFRMHEIDSEHVKRVPDIRNLLSHLQQFEQDEARRFFAWSKSKQGMNTATENQSATLHNNPVQVFFGQTGQALDVLAVLGPKHVNNVHEEEVLATFQNSIHVVGFKYKNQSYGVNQFRQLIKFLG